MVLNRVFECNATEVSVTKITVVVISTPKTYKSNNSKYTKKHGGCQV